MYLPNAVNSRVHSEEIADLRAFASDAANETFRETG